VVCQTPKVKVRQGIDDGSIVTGMEFTYDAGKVDGVIAEAYKMDGIFHVRVWLNKGILELGDDIMYVLIGGDIRPHVIDALQFLVGKIKNECVTEIEHKY
jgi:molybdopterin synthase catalytic subunit